MVIQEAPNGRIIVLYINNNPRENSFDMGSYHKSQSGEELQHIPHQNIVQTTWYNHTSFGDS